MVDPRFGGGPPVEDGLPAPDRYTDDLDQQAQSMMATITQQMSHWFGTTEQHQDQTPDWFNP